MVVVDVLKLDGSREQVELGAAATVADLRDRLEANLPRFHEVRLLHNSVELEDGAGVEREVTAVTQLSPAKAIRQIYDSAKALDPDEVCPEHIHIHEEQALRASEALGEMARAGSLSSSD